MFKVLRLILCFLSGVWLWQQLGEFNDELD